MKISFGPLYKMYCEDEAFNPYDLSSIPFKPFELSMYMDVICRKNNQSEVV